MFGNNRNMIAFMTIVIRTVTGGIDLLQTSGTYMYRLVK
ncbi:hypothetical protein EC23916_4026 [Escherichia coli 2.3916]|nr:hypothetical protein ECSTECS1191_3949 [Escherichia coli STEC_S1191]EII46267.1 hypothetical protein EC23916_4026 [Escherichia coli 2.3916]